MWFSPLPETIVEMKSVRLYGRLDVRLDEIPRPEIGEDDVLIEVKASSLDGTDLEILHGVHRLQGANDHRVQGHEYAGVVAAVGSAVSSFREGDRVTGPWGINCTRCVYCRQGRSNLCLFQQHFGVVADGAWADFMRAPARILVPLPESLSFEDGALVCCAFPTAMRGVDRGRIQVGDSVAIFGLGQMGLSAVMAARLAGAKPIIGVDPVASRASLARCFGASSTVDPLAEDVVAAIRAASDSQGVDHCIVTVSSVAVPAGVPSVAATTMAATRPGGQIIFIGLPGRLEADFNQMQGRELSLVGSKAMLGPDYLAKLVGFVAAGGLDLDVYRSMITHRVHLGELCEALLGGGLRDATKVIILPG
jgi:threonine dehydrogenase-like Zn-dependent dehydrogenase